MKIFLTLINTFILTLTVFAASPEIYYLDNGMQVVLIENEAAPVIASSIIIQSGQRDEPLNMAGVSHFLEHLLFNGTTKRTQEQLYDEMDRLGGYNNAHTGENFTNFVILAGKENFEKALDIQTDMIFHSTMPPEKFEKEKGIVTEEIGQSFDRADYTADTHFAARFYAGTPYSYQTLGSKSSIKSLKRDEVYAYYQQHYRPNNMIAIITGDFRSQEIKPVVEKYLNAALPGKLQERPVYYPEFAQEPGIGSLNKHYEKTKNVLLRVGVLAPGRMDDSYFAGEILQKVLDKRLSETLSGGKDALAQSVSVEYFTDRDFGAYVLRAQLSVETNLQPAAEAFRNAFREIADNPVTPLEIANMVMAERSKSRFDSERPHFWAMMKAYLLGFHRFEFIADYYNKLSQVTPEAVSDLARALYDDGCFIPEAVLPYPDLSMKAESQTSAEVSRKLADNGMEIIAAPGSGSGVFAAHFLLKGRSMREPQGKTGITLVLHNMLLKGTTSKDESALQEAMDALGMQLEVTDNPFVPFDDYRTGPEYSYIRMEVPAENWEKALELTAEITLHPAFEPASLEAVRGMMMGSAARSGESASSRSRKLFMEKLLGGNVLAKEVDGSPRTLGGITIEDVKAYYQEYFTAGNVICTMVGDAPPAETAEKVSQLFAGMPDGKSLQYEQSVPVFTPGDFREKLGKKQSSIRLGYLLEKLPESDRAALTIANDLLSSKMSFELREVQGLAYSMGTAVGMENGWGYLTAAMGTGPENIDKALSGIKSELAKAAQGKYTEKEVTKAKNSYIGSRNMRLLTSANRAMYMGIHTMKGEPLDTENARLQAVREVTTEEVNKAAKKYFRNDNLLIVVIE